MISLSDSKRKSEREEAITHLRKVLKPGDTIFTVLRHVSRSGMMRHISVLKIESADRILDLDFNASKALGWSRVDKGDGVKVSGCGMDMGFHIVYSLSQELFPDGFDCIGKNCPSNDHVNRDDSKHHTSGGYALRQKWL